MRPNQTRPQPLEVAARSLHEYEDRIVLSTPEGTWELLQPAERQQYLDRAQAILDALRGYEFAVIDARSHGEACREGETSLPLPTADAEAGERE